MNSKRLEREIIKLETILYSGPRFRTIQLLARYVLRRVAAAERRGAKKMHDKQFKFLTNRPTWMRKAKR